jgi:probable rRNA maturation factor
MAASYEIVIANRQRTRRLDRKFIKRLVELILKEVFVDQAELGFHFVCASEMAKVHEEFMNIAGSTDVITFDHGSKPPEIIHGELFISIEDAIAQAREFRTAWQSEVVRYVIHGILHLLGYDDLESKARSKMKREESRLLKRMETQFDLRALERT